MIEKLSINSKILNSKRNLRIFIPDQVDGPFQVLYMHDGQNLYFDHDASYNHAWHIHETVAAMIHSKMLKPTIIVGIDHTDDRLLEYSPVDVSRISKELKITFDKPYFGDLYVDFIVHELKPFIDERYQTLKDQSNTLITGSSMGGVISMYAALKYQHIFGGIGMLSTASWYNQPAFLNLIDTLKTNHTQKFFIGVGTSESYDKPSLSKLYVKTNKQLFNRIKKMSPKTVLRIYQDAIHNESFWRVIAAEMLLNIQTK